MRDAAAAAYATSVLRQIAQGVLVHESEFLRSNAVVVQGRDGVLLIDPGVRREEIACLVNDFEDLGQVVTTGFSTHPHWDHVLWDARFGSAPRFGTTRGAAAIHDLLSDPGWKDRVAEVLPPDIADQIPLDLFGKISGLPAGTTQVPWDGAAVRVIEHQAHAAGHAALVVEDARVLVAGDMLSDTLIPFVDLRAADPIEDYLAGLRLLEGAADDVDVVVPGHGSVGGAADMRARIDLDRAYVQALRDGGGADDPRLDPSAPNGAWLPGVHERQRQQLAQRDA
jgi:glyoxylase-like metal-dependent hydrolase (beta-lactamase superfamily II)